VWVVIPYYQRRLGILRKALASVGRQDASVQVQVAIVDDESPASPAAEIEGWADSHSIRIHLYRQENGGPAAARNTALEAMPEDADYVAFLDSDDEWAPDHLGRAIRSLGADGDVYFANHYQLGQSVPGFERGARLDFGLHEPISELDASYRYVGDMFDQIMRGNVIGTSTVVARAAFIRGRKFDTRFRNAGEDYFFWMELAQAGARFVFSSKVSATYGEGVNVYSGAGWGSEQHLLRVLYETRYRRETGRRFPVSASQLEFLSRKRRELREEFAQGLLHLLKSRRSINWSVVRRQFADEPRTGLALLASVSRKLMRPGR
jgi:succinoglycan biosynthesis protein ExoW